MKHVLALTLIVSTTVGYAQTTPERQVITAAAEALGGADRIQKVGVITMEGVGMSNSIGQARTPKGDDLENPLEPTAIWSVTQFKRTIDVPNGRARQQWRRTPAFASPQPDGSQNVGLDGNIAFTHRRQTDRRRGRMTRRRRRAGSKRSSAIRSVSCTPR